MKAKLVVVEKIAVTQFRISFIQFVLILMIFYWEVIKFGFRVSGFQGAFSNSSLTFYIR